MDLSEFTRGDPAGEAGEEMSRAVARTHVRRVNAELDRALQEPIERMLYVEREPRPPDPFNAIFGAGVILQPDGLRPVVCVEERLAPRGKSVAEALPQLYDLPEVASLLQERAEIFPRDDTVVLALPHAELHYGPGRGVRGIGSGTLGARVQTDTGVEGILTAGHVAPAGAVVHNTSGASADVVFSIDPAQLPAAQVAPDVAVLVPHLPNAWHPGTPVTGMRVSAPGERVTLVGHESGEKTTTIVGAMPEYWVSAASGMWASVYLTAESFSQRGDSGGPVTAEKTSNLVGHVIGGSGSFTSFVQSIDVQLKVTGATLWP